MNRSVTLLGIGICAAGIAACKDVVPAVIVEPTDASRQALQDAVNEALGTEVMLAPTALTDTSVLYIERKPMLSDDGLPIEGRIREASIELRLVTDGSKCILVDQRDRSRYTLSDTTCAPE